jgi:arsenate reductase (glutaredoxin)
MKVYTYAGCSTCRDAVEWLRSRGIEFKELPIRETPPPLAELRAVLKASGGNLRTLFNTSGMDYRAMGLKDKLPGLTQDEALALLASNGNLIKRPFVIDTAKGIHLTGFKEKDWAAVME